MKPLLLILAIGALGGGVYFRFFAPRNSYAGHSWAELAVFEAALKSPPPQTSRAKKRDVVRDGWDTAADPVVSGRLISEERTRRITEYGLFGVGAITGIAALIALKRGA
jgi:hypothetical protein